MGGKKSRRTKKRSKTSHATRTRKYIYIKKEADEPFYVCKVCKKRFRQKSTFQLHCLIHKSEQTFSCDICKEEFPFLSRLQKHCLLEHSNDLLVVGQESDQVGSKSTKPYTCGICDRGFLVNYALKKHITTVHEKSYNGCDEELLHITSPKKSYKRKPAVSSKVFNSEEDFSRVRKQKDTGSVGIRVKKELDENCGESFDPKKVCDTLWNEGPSSKNDLSQLHVKSDGSPELCVKMESDSFDPRDACVTLWNEGSSSCDEGSADSTEQLDDSIKQFSCPMCNRQFLRESNMHSHLRTHDPKPADYTTRFRSDQPLPSQPSGNLVPLNIGPFLCEICHKGFVKNEDFQKHCLTHSEQNMYTCKVCSKQFARYSNFRAHCETHIKKNTFNCNFCGTNFHFEKHLIDHQQMQSANAKLKCEFCHQKFDQACSLTIHEQVHRGYHCNNCGSVFSQAGALKRHQRSHANKSKCGVCAKTFTTNILLRQHLETHFGSKTYRCEVCSEEFKFKHRLRIHRTTHRDDMPHTCQLCNQGFLHAWSLRNHLLKHEANQDAEMWQSGSLATGENVENMESPGKAAIKETSESFEGIEKIIKKEKDY